MSCVPLQYVAPVLACLASCSLPVDESSNPPAEAAIPSMTKDPPSQQTDPRSDGPTDIRLIAASKGTTVYDVPLFAELHPVMRESYNACLQSKEAPSFADCRAAVQHQFLVHCRVKLSLPQRDCSTLMERYCRLLDADADVCGR